MLQQVNLNWLFLKTKVIKKPSGPTITLWGFFFLRTSGDVKKHAGLWDTLQICSAPLRAAALLTPRGAVQWNSGLCHLHHLQGDFSSQTLQLGLWGSLFRSTQWGEGKQQFSRECRSPSCWQRRRVRFLTMKGLLVPHSWSTWAQLWKATVRSLLCHMSKWLALLLISTEGRWRGGGRAGGQGGSSEPYIPEHMPVSFCQIIKH